MNAILEALGNADLLKNTDVAILQGADGLLDLSLPVNDIRANVVRIERQEVNNYSITYYFVDGLDKTEKRRITVHRDGIRSEFCTTTGLCGG